MNTARPPAGTSATAARALTRRARRAALATNAANSDAWPYASLVSVACDSDGSPILLLSELSDHTRNLKNDSRASLLFEAAAGRANPQTGPRVTVMGTIEASTEERHARRFLARHPAARAYAGFGDFRFYRMRMARAHVVAGFAAARWLDGDRLASDGDAARALAQCEVRVVGHMNGDHADAVALYASALLGRRPGAWEMTGVDPDGADLCLASRFARLDFARPVADAAACRAELVRLATRARNS